METQWFKLITDNLVSCVIAYMLLKFFIEVMRKKLLGNNETEKQNLQKNIEIFITSTNTGVTAITDLDNPTIGQTITLVGGSDTNASTIADADNFKLSAAMTLGLDDSITLFVKADNYYIELNRSVN